RNAEHAVIARDAHALHRDALAEPLLERTLDQELRRGSELIGERLEDEGEETAAERRTVHAFSRAGEEHLLDEVTEMLVIARARRAPPTIDVVRVIDVHARHLTSRPRAPVRRPVSAASQWARTSTPPS